MKKVINIDCEGTAYLDIDELKNFQGNLKELHEDDYNKLKESILSEGFKFPVFIWGKNIIDGHGRIFVVRKLMSEGYKLSGKIPVIKINAKNEKQAKKLILLLNSKYQKITKQGLYEFIEESGLDFDELKNQIIIPEINLAYFENEFYKEGAELPEMPDLPKANTTKIKYKCPKCGHQWQTKDKEKKK